MTGGTLAPGPHGGGPLPTRWRPSIRLLQPFFPATISREILMGRCFICPYSSRPPPPRLAHDTADEAVTEH